MRRLIAITMMTLILAMSLTAPVGVSAADEPTLLFEMKINETESGFTISDASPNSIVDGTKEINYNPKSATENATYGEYTLGETTTPYLTFASCSDTTGDSFANTKSAIKVPIKSSVALANKDNLTIETWVRPSEYFGKKTSAYNGIVAFGKKGFATKETAAFMLRADSVSLGNTIKFTSYPAIGEAVDVFNEAQASADPLNVWKSYGWSTVVSGASGATNRFAKDTEALTQSAYADKWTHIVVTRSWVVADETTGKGHWNTTIYLDGKKVATAAFPEAGAFAQKHAGYANSGEDTSAHFTELLIGNSSDKIENAFRGDIANLNIYEGTFSDNEIYSKYVTSSARFFERVGIESLTHNSADNSFDMTFTGPVKAEAIPSSITVKRGDKAIDATVVAGTLDADGCTTTAKITPNTAVGYSEEYTVYIAATLVDKSDGPLSDSQKTITTNPSPFGAATVSGTIGGGNVTVSMPISGATEGETFAVALIVMDSEGRIIDFKSDPKQAAADGTATLSVSTTQAASGCTVQAIAWRIDSVKGACAISQEIVLK